MHDVTYPFPENFHTPTRHHTRDTFCHLRDKISISSLQVSIDTKAFDILLRNAVFSIYFDYLNYFALHFYKSMYLIVILYDFSTFILYNIPGWTYFKIFPKTHFQLPVLQLTTIFGNEHKKKTEYINRTYKLKKEEKTVTLKY